jgi:hypothetical protein
MSSSFAAGKYRAQIVNWGFSKAKSGNPQIFWSVKPIGKITPGGDLENCPDWERTIFRAITDKTIEFVAVELKALGYNYDTFDQIDRNHPQAFNFGAGEVTVEMKHEMYQGKQQERWQFCLGKAFEPTPVERGEVAKLNAMFGGNLKMARMSVAANSPPITTQRAPHKLVASPETPGNGIATEGIDDGEIPF